MIHRNFIDSQVVPWELNIFVQCEGDSPAMYLEKLHDLINELESEVETYLLQDEAVRGRTD